MRRAALLCVASLSLAGCTLIWGPDYEEIPPDSDGGMDGGMADAGDAGRDGGPDAGDGGMMCEPLSAVEFGPGYEDGCRGGVDDDCDGLVDCFDPDCGESLDCCGAGTVWNAANSFTGSGWVEIPSGTGSVIAADPTEITDFGPSPRALLHAAECAPLAFGLDLEVNFRILPGCSGCNDFASLALTPTDDMAEGARLTTDVALVVEADGTAHLERAGEMEEGSEVTGLPANERIRAELRLRPGTDSGGAVLLVTARLTYDSGDTTVTLGEPNQPLLLLEDLRGFPFCPDVGDNIDGQMVAIEGRGDLVRVQALSSSSPVRTVGGTQRACANPSYFEPLDLRSYEDSFADCHPGQWGEPTILNYCLSCGTIDPPDFPWWDLWIDTTATEREDPLGGYPDFEICGSRTDLLTGSTSWQARTGGGGPPALPPSGMSQSVREPFVWAPVDAGPGTFLQVVWAQRSGADTAEHDLYLGEVRLSDPALGFGSSIRPILRADEVAGCESLRDPALMPRGETTPDDGLWLLFTCEGQGTDPNSIGAAALAWNGTDGAYELEDGSVRTDVLTGDIGPYASRGPFSPEPVAEFDAGKIRVQLWFLARSGGSDVAVAFASGEGSAGADSELPELMPYPANPVLRPDDPDVFSGDCASGCRFNGLGVTRAIGSRDYQMVIGRTIAGSPDTHELVPLRQRRPNL